MRNTVWWMTLAAVLAGGCGPTREVDSMICDQPEALTCDIAGACVHALQAGSGSREVLFLHGARFSARTWEETGTLQLLARHGYRAVSIDLPGYGKSTGSTDQPERFLGALLDELEFDRPVIVSPSMSGRYSLPFAARCPERLSGFVAVAPVGVARFAQELGAARVRTLILWGRGDAVIPLTGAEELAALLPDSRVEIIEAAGHACYIDQPREFHELLLGFLSEVFGEP